jgi:hypothetical protein
MQDELQIGQRYFTHDFSEGEWVEVVATMQQSIKVVRPNGEWYFQTPGLWYKHLGPKDECEWCIKWNRSKDLLKSHD